MSIGKATVRLNHEALTISLTDTHVAMLGGTNYEVAYSLDTENTAALKRALRDDGMWGSLRSTIPVFFGEHFSMHRFETYCEKRRIRFNKFTWLDPE